jgi:methionyl-tRNA formyltransferase
MQSGFGPRTCPGLSVSATGLFWRDTLGREFNLLTEKRLSPGEAAIRLNRSTEWVLRKIRANELYPHVYFNPRLVEVWECGLSDYIVRTVVRNEEEGRTDAAA